MSNPGTLRIDSPELSLEYTATEGTLQLSQLRAAGHDLISTPSPVFGLDNDAVNILDVEVEKDGQTICATSRIDGTDVALHITVSMDPDASIAVVSTTLCNEGDKVASVTNPSSFLAQFGNPAPATARVIRGGKWNENIPPRAYQSVDRYLNAYHPNLTIQSGQDGRSTTDWLPQIILHGDDGGLIIALAWSGHWSISGTRESSTWQLVAGIAQTTLTLEPGKTLRLPDVLIHGFSGSIDNGADSWRGWLDTHWTPDTPENWPWIQYNHWYAYYGDIDESRLMEEAPRAAEIGCEVFVIDDGWFQNRRPDSYFLGWGDWTEDRTKFPNGLKAFGDHIRSLGMKFGIWVEPERVDHTGQLAEQHPDWFALTDGNPYNRDRQGLQGHHLCLGNPEVQEWMADDISRVVRDYGIDWLKWDYNIGYTTGCTVPDHGHGPEDGSYAHTLGLYNVLNNLRSNCPDLMIENCASGGHRIDLGIARYTHTNWASDFTHLAASTRQHQLGAGLAYPLSFNNTWVLEHRSITECRSRYGGAYGVSAHLESWTNEDRATFRQSVDEYTRMRPLLTGMRVTLSGPNHQAWDVTQYSSENGASHAILAFGDEPSLPAITVIPQHIDPHARWTIEDADTQSVTTMAGIDLSASGLNLERGDGSRLIWITKESA